MTVPSTAMDVVSLLIFAFAWVGPLGLFVLRRHLAEASRPRAAAKAVMVGLTAITAPVAAAALLVMLAGAFDAFGTLWSLLRYAW